MSDKKFKIYTASAGSGKTYTIVKEFLILSLSDKNVSCKDILAVTFTNKAANEMKGKVLDNLNGIVNDDKNFASMKKDILDALKIDENVLKERAVKLYDTILHNYSDFSISTIDSFIQQISRSFSKELNLPALYKVLVDDDDLLDELVQTIDKQIAEDNESLTEILTDFVNFQLDEENSLRIDVALKEYVRKLLKENAYKRGEIFDVQPLENVEYQEIKNTLNALNSQYEKKILDDIEEIRSFEEEYNITKDDYNAKSNGLPSIIKKIENDYQVEPTAVATKTIKTIVDNGNWYSNKINKETIDKINKSGVDAVDLYKNLIRDHQDFFLVNIVRKNLYLYALRRTLLCVVNQHIDETNKVHISEFNKRISDIIGDCSVPFIYERIGSRYKHFFIDEFQDTSLLQWHNFLPLVNNSLSEGKMNLLVGDAKQAIYRFRSGEVEQIIKLPYIYGGENNAFTRECEGNFNRNFNQCFLKSNYRSKKNIIDFNNSFFKLSKHKLTSEEYRRVYDNLEQDCPKNYDYDGLVSVEIFDMSKFEDDDSTVKSYKDAVKRSILNDVGELLCKGFRYRDITVLVRSNSDGSQIAEFLSENNIPVISSDSILLKSSDKVRLIILTLKYLSDDKNNVTRLALSFYKNVCADAGECDIQKALEDTFDKDEIYRIRNRAYSLYDLCDNIIKMYGFNVIEDEFLQYFMDLVQEWQNSENNGVNAFVEYWEKKSDTFFVKIAGDIDAVQVMTIHKSKGLEFKVVMYPYAYTKVPDRMRGNEKWLSSDEFELLKEVPHVDDFILPISKSLVDTKMEKHYAEEVDKAAFDDFNIMYVAMTRPSDLIYIYTNNKTKDDSYNFFTEYFSVPQNGYKSEKLEVVVEQEDVDFINRFECIEKEQSARFVIGNVHYIKEEKKKCSKILELDEKSVPQSLEWTDVLEIEPDPTMFWMEDEKEFLPQEWGNLVHDILSKINTVDDADKVLRNYINEGSIDHHIAELLREQFEVIFNIKEIKEAYSKDAIVRNEMDILINDKYNGNVIIRPDRYAELSDRVLLIDYKTGSHHEKYYEQLRNYVVALQDMGVKKNIEAYLLYLGENIEIKPVFLDRLF